MKRSRQMLADPEHGEIYWKLLRSDTVAKYRYIRLNNSYLASLIDDENAIKTINHLLTENPEQSIRIYQRVDQAFTAIKQLQTALEKLQKGQTI